MLRIALCDDESRIYTALQKMLTQYQEERGGKSRFEYSLQYFSTSQRLLEAEGAYDILFLDIMLESSVNGIEVGQHLRKKGINVPIIFLTSLTDKYKDGYKARATDFVIKPIQYNKFLEALHAALNTLSIVAPRIMVTHNRQETVVLVKDIIYIHTYYRKTEIVCKSGHEVCTESLDELELLLPSYCYRLSKTHIINFEYVQNMSRQEITLASGIVIRFQRGNTKQVKDANIAFNTYLMEVRTYV